MVNPEKFCESMHLCKEGMKISIPTKEGTCGLCHHVLVEVLLMLKDPNTQVIAVFSLSVHNALCIVLLCTLYILSCLSIFAVILQLEAIDLLIKTCSKAQNYEQQVN